MTGKRLLIQKLSYDYYDYGHTWYRKSMCKTRKKWSKIPRRILKQDLNNQLLNI